MTESKKKRPDAVKTGAVVSDPRESISATLIRDRVNVAQAIDVATILASSADGIVYLEIVGVDTCRVLLAGACGHAVGLDEIPIWDKFVSGVLAALKFKSK